MFDAIVPIEGAEDWKMERPPQNPDGRSRREPRQLLQAIAQV
jgi:hypothetical protein